MDITILPEYRENPEALAEKLSSDDISQLVDLLSEKIDDIRYSAFLVLQKRSEKYADVYPHWFVFQDKLDEPNSYQRSIGIMLMAENVKWDEKGFFSQTFESYMSHCQDEKFITSRQSIQSIAKWAENRPELLAKTAAILMNVKIELLKDTQRKLILIDIINALLLIRGISPIDGIDQYIHAALTGGILDKKSIKEIVNRL